MAGMNDYSQITQALNQIATNTDSSNLGRAISNGLGQDYLTKAIVDALGRYSSGAGSLKVYDSGLAQTVFNQSWQDREKAKVKHLETISGWLTENLRKSIETLGDNVDKIAQHVEGISPNTGDNFPNDFSERMKGLENAIQELQNHLINSQQASPTDLLNSRLGVVQFRTDVLGYLKTISESLEGVKKTSWSDTMRDIFLRSLEFVGQRMSQNQTLTQAATGSGTTQSQQAVQQAQEQAAQAAQNLSRATQEATRAQEEHTESTRKSAKEQTDFSEKLSKAGTKAVTALNSITGMNFSAGGVFDFLKSLIEQTTPAANTLKIIPDYISSNMKYQQMLSSMYINEIADRNKIMMDAANISADRIKETILKYGVDAQTARELILKQDFYIEQMPYVYRSEMERYEERLKKYTTLLETTALSTSSAQGMARVIEQYETYDKLQGINLQSSDVLKMGSKRFANIENVMDAMGATYRDMRNTMNVDLSQISQFFNQYFAKSVVLSSKSQGELTKKSTELLRVIGDLNSTLIDSNDFLQKLLSQRDTRAGKFFKSDIGQFLLLNTDDAWGIKQGIDSQTPEGLKYAKDAVIQGIRDTYSGYSWEEQHSEAFYNLLEANKADSYKDLIYAVLADDQNKTEEAFKKFAQPRDRTQEIIDSMAKEYEFGWIKQLQYLPNEQEKRRILAQQDGIGQALNWANQLREKGITIGFDVNSWKTYEQNLATAMKAYGQPFTNALNQASNSLIGIGQNLLMTLVGLAGTVTTFIHGITTHGIKSLLDTGSPEAEAMRARMNPFEVMFERGFFGTFRNLGGLGQHILEAGANANAIPDAMSKGSGDTKTAQASASSYTPQGPGMPKPEMASLWDQEMQAVRDSNETAMRILNKEDSNARSPILAPLGGGAMGALSGQKFLKNGGFRTGSGWTGLLLSMAAGGYLSDKIDYYTAGNPLMEILLQAGLMKGLNLSANALSKVTPYLTKEGILQGSQAVKTGSQAGWAGLKNLGKGLLNLSSYEKAAPLAQAAQGTAQTAQMAQTAAQTTRAVQTVTETVHILGADGKPISSVTRPVSNIAGNIAKQGTQQVEKLAVQQAGKAVGTKAAESTATNLIGTQLAKWGGKVGLTKALGWLGSRALPGIGQLLLTKDLGLMLGDVIRDPLNDWFVKQGYADLRKFGISQVLHLDKWFENKKMSDAENIFLAEHLDKLKQGGQDAIIKSQMEKSNKSGLVGVPTHERPGAEDAAQAAKDTAKATKDSEKAIKDSSVKATAVARQQGDATRRQVLAANEYLKRMGETTTQLSEIATPAIVFFSKFNNNLAGQMNTYLSGMIELIRQQKSETGGSPATAGGTAGTGGGEGFKGYSGGSVFSYQPSGAYRENRGNHLHNGVDFPAPGGTPLPATEKAVVADVEHNPALGGGYGKLVFLKGLESGMYIGYAHLSEVNARIGEQVEPGQMIGRVGNTGHSFGDHLHFMVGTNVGFPASDINSTMDPLAYLKGKNIPAVSAGAKSAGGKGAANRFAGLPSVLSRLPGFGWVTRGKPLVTASAGGVTKLVSESESAGALDAVRDSWDKGYGKYQLTYVPGSFDNWTPFVQWLGTKPEYANLYEALKTTNSAVPSSVKAGMSFLTKNYRQLWEQAQDEYIVKNYLDVLGTEVNSRSVPFRSAALSFSVHRGQETAMNILKKSGALSTPDDMQALVKLYRYALANLTEGGMFTGRLTREAKSLGIYDEVMAGNRTGDGWGWEGIESNLLEPFISPIAQTSILGSILPFDYQGLRPFFVNMMRTGSWMRDDSGSAYYSPSNARADYGDSMINDYLSVWNRGSMLSSYESPYQTANAPSVGISLDNTTYSLGRFAHRDWGTKNPGKVGHTAGEFGLYSGKDVQGWEDDPFMKGLHDRSRDRWVKGDTRREGRLVKKGNSYVYTYVEEKPVAQAAPSMPASAPAPPPAETKVTVQDDPESKAERKRIREGIEGIQKRLEHNAYADLAFEKMIQTGVEQAIVSGRAVPTHAGTNVARMYEAQQQAYQAGISAKSQRSNKIH